MTKWMFWGGLVLLFASGVLFGFAVAEAEAGGPWMIPPEPEPQFGAGIFTGAARRERNRQIAEHNRAVGEMQALIAGGLPACEAFNLVRARLVPGAPALECKTPKGD
jgi:hypothetical protein